MLGPIRVSMSVRAGPSGATCRWSFHHREQHEEQEASTTVPCSSRKADTVCGPLIRVLFSVRRPFDLSYAQRRGRPRGVDILLIRRESPPPLLLYLIRGMRRRSAAPRARRGKFVPEPRRFLGFASSHSSPGKVQRIPYKVERQ